MAAAMGHSHTERPKRVGGRGRGSSAQGETEATKKDRKGSSRDQFVPP